MRCWAISLPLGVLGCSSSATLPRGPLTFAPDGKRALIWSEGKLGLYDLKSRRSQWQVTSAEPQTLVISPRGTYFALAERFYQERTRLLVYRAADGVAVAPPIEPGLDGAGVGPQVPCSVSDDGRSLATIGAGGAYVYDLATGKPVGEIAGRLYKCAFQPDSSLLALDQEDQVLVAERAGERVTQLSRLPSRGFYSWVAGGLAVVNAGGVDLWSGGNVRSVLRAPIKWGRTAAEASYVTFSSDGGYFANETAQGLVIYDLKAGSELVTRPDLKGIFGVAFRGSRAQVIWDDNSSDEATMSWASELELPSGRTLSSKELGKRVGWVKRSALNPHAGPDGHFIPKLSPSGDFVDLESLRALQEHDIRALN